MKQLTVFITVIIFSVTGFGQDTVKQIPATVEVKRVLLGINISPDICYRTLKNNDGSSSSSTIIDIRNNTEKQKFGYTTGLNACYNISKHIGIETGLQYSNKGYFIKRTGFIYGNMYDPRRGFVSNNSATEPTNAKFIYNYIYLDVPLRLIFSFGEKRIHLITGIGVTTNILLKATQTIILGYENGDKKRQTQKPGYNYKSLDVSPNVSVGIDYRISNKINLRIEPTFRYGAIKIIDAPITEYLWNGGLNITCYYGLK